MNKHLWTCLFIIFIHLIPTTLANSHAKVPTYVATGRMPSQPIPLGQITDNYGNVIDDCNPSTLPQPVPTQPTLPQPIPTQSTPSQPIPTHFIPHPHPHPHTNNYLDPEYFNEPHYSLSPRTTNPTHRHIIVPTYHTKHSLWSFTFYISTVIAAGIYSITTSPNLESLLFTIFIFFLIFIITLGIYAKTQPAFKFRFIFTTIFCFWNIAYAILYYFSLNPIHQLVPLLFTLFIVFCSSTTFLISLLTHHSLVKHFTLHQLLRIKRILLLIFIIFSILFLCTKYTAHIYEHPHLYTHIILLLKRSTLAVAFGFYLFYYHLEHNYALRESKPLYNLYIILFLIALALL
ncbi:hypothetical protein NEHOM01_0371 [Nematocida homosporus]|uniref:uncharacterized protein n=1 Tax=Nematocida homosporus TaxID=1912981 RepID=UPI00221FA719|nr:uncharacterized protein NEHOM01_0371 [Nematocida homosporus]KAI5184769.1 hypothetical protein NEHOM01_0371 [Nematocida homosporus]